LRLNAHTDDTQTTLTEETAADHIRRKAGSHITDGSGLRDAESRFLAIVPSDTEISELPELWEVYQEAISGEE